MDLYRPACSQWTPTSSHIPLDISIRTLRATAHVPLHTPAIHNEQIHQIHPARAPCAQGREARVWTVFISCSFVRRAFGRDAEVWQLPPFRSY